MGYTGPALESYRCYTVWLWDTTRATRICDTLAWFPTKIAMMPLASSNDLIVAGIQDIVQALKYPSPKSPIAPLTDSHHDALVQLTSILTSIVSPIPDTPQQRELTKSPAQGMPDPSLRVASPHHARPPIPDKAVTEIPVAPLRVTRNHHGPYI